MWATRSELYSSMKWHIADPATLEEYEEKDYWAKTSTKRKVVIHCGKKSTWTLKSAKVKDKINIYQNNVCTYCRNKILEDEGLESRLLK